MWRFILVTFGFLAFAFYELSGGADYVPAENSLQARGADERPVGVTQEKSKPTVTTSLEDLRTTRLEQLETTTADRFDITLASVNSSSFKTEKVKRVPTAADEKAALLTAPNGTDPVDAAVAQALTDQSSAGVAQNAEKIWPGAIELFSQRQTRQEERRTTTRETARASADIRYVTGNVVNMRGGPGTDYERIASLTQGTQVAVLERSGDGWLMLRVTATGQEGWMADWLVSEPVN